MKKIIVTNIDYSNPEREINTIGNDTFNVSAFWTLNNGLEVHVHYYKAEGLYSSYKSVSVSPFVGHKGMSYEDVRDGLGHVMNAVQAWVNRRADRSEWRIRFEL